MNDYLKWIEIDTKAILHNIELIKNHISNASILGVVKANAYGHGMVEVAKLIEPHVEYLGVGHVTEGSILRKNNIQKPILILSPYFKAEDIVQYHLTPSIESIQQLDFLFYIARKHKTVIPFHLKINTGMNRFGISPSEVDEFCQQVKFYSSYLLFEGVYSHFATTYQSNKQFTLHQLNTFKKCLETVRHYFPSIRYIHIANSKATIDFPDSHFNMVRIGNLLYGKIVEQSNIGFKTAFSAKAKIMTIRTLSKGESLGYGVTFTASKPTRVGIIPIGTYDGFLLGQQTSKLTFKDITKLVFKSLIKKEAPKVFYQEQPIPLIGKPSTQFSFIDITHLPKIKEGDIVTVHLPIFSAKEDIPRIYL